MARRVADGGFRAHDRHSADDDARPHQDGSDKAKRELGYASRPVRSAIEDAVGWFRANGMLRT